MMEQGLIEDAPEVAVDEEDARRRYLRVTELGIRTAREEAERMEELVRAARSKRVFFPGGARA